MGFDRFARRGELSVVHECSTLVVKAPKLPGDEFAIPGEKCRRACGLVLVERLAFRIGCGVTRGADVMQLEIGVSLHHNRSKVSLQARKGQSIARQVHGECRSTDRIVRGSELQVRCVGTDGWIVRIGLKVDPAGLPGETWIVIGSERQSGVACCAADLIEHGLTHDIRVLHRRIVWNHATWNGQRGLEQGNRGQVGGGELVGEAIAIRIGIEPETLFRLHTVVMIEGIVAELPYRDYVADLMQRPDDQAWWSGALGGQARGRQALHSGSIPRAVGVVRESSEGNSLGRQLAAVSWRRGVALCLQVRGHLPGQHFDKAGAVHTDRLSIVSGVVHCDEVPRFIHSTAGRNAVVMIERQAIKAGLYTSHKAGV